MSLREAGEQRTRRRLEAKIELSEQEPKSIEEMSREELILELKKARKEILIQKGLKENAIKRAQGQALQVLVAQGQATQKQDNPNDIYKIVPYTCPTIAGHPGGLYIIEKSTGRIVGSLEERQFKNRGIPNAVWDGYTLWIGGIAFIKTRLLESTRPHVYVR